MTKKSHALDISSSNTWLLGLAAQMLMIMSAAAQSRPAASQQPSLMDRQKEIALALSACPPLLASKAAVYVLDKSGYVKVRDSENGFMAIVQHSLPASVSDTARAAVLPASDRAHDDRNGCKRNGGRHPGLTKDEPNE